MTTSIDRVSARLLGIFLLVSVVACSGSQERAFESTAQQANPILLRLKPTIAMLRMARDPDAVSRACNSADHELEALAVMTIDEQDLSALDYAHYSAIERLHHSAQTVMHAGMCGRTHLYACSWWCSQFWRGLIDDVETVRRHAQEHGVEIVSLKEQREAARDR
jgi:hypothetical protein